MKYHINPETGVVSPCKAKIRCRFGGESGHENHFESESDARVATEALLNLKNPVSSIRRKDVEFIKDRAFIVEALAQSGLISSDDQLPTVTNESEMIDKWFGGSKNKYRVISRMAKTKNLKAHTRKAVGKLSENFSVAVIEDPNPKSSRSKGSHIDFIADDTSLTDIKAGAHPF
jgi:Mor family transcriptional regulator